MPRNYSNDISGGTAASGRAYTPQVTPDNQDDDTANVTGHRNVGRDIEEDPEHRSERRRGEGDVINRRDLQPTYEVMDRADRHDNHADKDRDRDGQRHRDRDDDRPRERWHGAASRPHSFDDRERQRLVDNNEGFGNPPYEGQRGFDRDAGREERQPGYMRRREQDERRLDTRGRRGDRDDDRDVEWDDSFRNAYPRR